MAREADDSRAVLVCEREYRQTGDPATGVALAGAFRHSRQPVAATTLATSLLASSAHATAVQVLGKIALDDHRSAAAHALLSLSRVLHILEDDPQGGGVDAQALASIYTAEKRYTEALRALDDCIVDTQRAHDETIEGYCHLSAAIALGEVGYLLGAHRELALAEPRMKTERDLAWIALVRGQDEQNYGLGASYLRHNASAVVDLEQAIQHADAARQPEIARSAELGLVYSLAELGKVDLATQHLARAETLDTEGTDGTDRALLEARIAFHRGDFARASSLITQTYGQLSDQDDRVRACVLQAQIGIATHDLGYAAAWAARGVEAAESIRGALSAIELRPWMLSLRRQPHELLFVALAQTHQLEEALVAFDRWQGRTLLDALTRPRSIAPPSLRGAAGQTEAVLRVFPRLSNAPISQPIDRATLLAALRQVDLVALLVANDEVWRITARHGALAITTLGPLSALQATLDRFAATPTVPELGEALGQRLLGDDSFRPTTDPLFVLLDGAMTALPVAALRAGSQLLPALRPIVHAARLTELACIAPLPATSPATVIADARGDLPRAKHEAELAASRFGVRPLLGPGATSAALFAADHEGRLHVAMHARVELGAGVLDLADRPVSALEVAAGSAGPRLVFLSGCASAASEDGELSSSLATAFLASGSTQVIATLRPVNDDGASELTAAFYREGGATDPARALARAQAAAAGTSNVDWPNFALFGHDICRKEFP